MKISELAEELEIIRSAVGNIEVQVASSTGSLVDLKNSGVLTVTWPENRKTVFISNQ